MILFLKAVDRHDTQTMALFVTPTVIDGYTRKDGTLVRPHVARRPHAAAKHPAKVAAKQQELLNFEHNAPVDNTGAAMDAELKGIPAAVASLPPGVPDDGPSEPEWAPRPNKRDVPEYLLAQVEAIVEKANRRAKKLGVDGFTLVKGEPFDRDVSVDKSGLGLQPKQWVRFVPVTIEGPAIKAPGGWKLQGRVDFEDGSVIVNSRPGTELPKRFRTISPICDHCKSDRQRNAVFVFGRDSDYMQVGRQCLKDYLGHSPEAALWAASEFSIFDDIDRELDEDRADGMRRSQLVGLDDVMTAAAWAVRETGFFSRKAAEERGMSSTSDDVAEALLGKGGLARAYQKTVTQADKDKAAAVIAWVQSEWGAKGDEASDYEYNAVELTARRAVHVRRIGLLTSLVAAFDRANEESVSRAKRVDAWVGKVGERREFEATFAGSNSFDTAYGVMFVLRFDSPEGLLVYKGGTPDWAVDANGGKSLQAGDVIKFVGTIKEHADYKGTKQTLVSRCAVVKEKPAKAKKAAAAPAVDPAPNPWAPAKPWYQAT